LDARSISPWRVELKAGTWQPETVAPGSGTFDRVKVVR
jgi:hypothetical protein